MCKYGCVYECVVSFTWIYAYFLKQNILHYDKNDMLQRKDMTTKYVYLLYNFNALVFLTVNIIHAFQYLEFKIP